MAVSLDPFRNIVNVGWGGGLFILHITYTHLWRGANGRFFNPELHDELIPDTPEWVSTIHQPHRHFLTIQDPLDAYPPPPTLFIPTGESRTTIFPTAEPPAPTWATTGGGALKFLAWRYEQNQIDYTGVDNPDWDGLPWNLKELPVKTPEVFIPHNLRGMQCGYFARYAQGGIGGPSWEVGTPFWIAQMSYGLYFDIVWTINLSLLGPPFVPEENYYRLRYTRVRDPAFPGYAETQSPSMAINAGIYKPFPLDKILEQQTDTPVLGEIVHIPQFPTDIEWTNNAVCDIHIMRGEPETELFPKIVIERIV